MTVTGPVTITNNEAGYRGGAIYNRGNLVLPVDADLSSNTAVLVSLDFLFRHQGFPAAFPVDGLGPRSGFTSLCETICVGAAAGGKQDKRAGSSSSAYLALRTMWSALSMLSALLN